MKYLIGLIMLAVGILFVWKSAWFVSFFGRIGWAEQKLGSGGTWTFYKIGGVLLIFIALFILTSKSV